MPSAQPDQFDIAAASLADAATKLAQIFKQREALRAELEAASAHADSAGLGDFAGLFRTMAAKLGSLGNQNNKPHATSAKRRGRPPKSADNPTEAN